MSPPRKENARRSRPGTGYIEAYSKLYASNPAPIQTQKQAPVLRGCRCQCSACSLCFNSDYAFCTHRAGLYTERRCLTEAEMLTKGMCLVGNFWVSKRRAAQTIPVDAFSSKTGPHSSVVTAKAVICHGSGAERAKRAHGAVG